MSIFSIIDFKRLIIMSSTCLTALSTPLSNSYAQDMAGGLGYYPAHAVTNTVATPIPAAQFSAAKENYLLNINRTEIVRLPINASAIVVGNPDIADISVHSADTVFVIGRNFGETNLVVLDKNGQLLLDATLQVTAQLPQNGVRLHYGNGQRETYHCAPYCVGAPEVGDLPAFTAQNINENAAAGDSANTQALGVPNIPNFGGQIPQPPVGFGS